MQKIMNSPYYALIRDTSKHITMTIKFNSRQVLLLLIYFTLSNSSYGQQQHEDHQAKNSVFISGTLREGLDSFDTIYIEVFDDHLAEYNSILPHRYYAVPYKNGKFSITIDSIFKLTYFNISPSKLKGRASIVNIHSLRNLIMMPGDSINLVNNIVKGNPYWYVSFGQGAEKYTCLNSIDRITDLMKKLFTLKSIVDRSKRNQESIVQEIDKHISNYDTIYREQKIILDRYKTRLSSHISEVISINLRCENLLEKFNRLRLSIDIFKSNDIDTTDYLPILRAYESDIRAGINELFLTFPDSILIDSYALPKSIHEYLLLKEALSEQPFDIYEHIRFIKNQLMRDKILFLYFLNRHQLMKGDNVDVQTTVLENISNPLYRDILSEVYNNIKVGNKTYNFNLPDAHNNRIQLSNFLGKVVFIDFWYTGCGGCIQYYRDVLKHAKAHFKENKDIIFITISIDADTTKWKNAIASGYYTSDDAVNLYTEGLGGTHPVIKHYGVKAYPRPLLLDSKGRVYNASNDDLRAGGTQKLISVIEECIKQE